MYGFSSKVFSGNFSNAKKYFPKNFSIAKNIFRIFSELKKNSLNFFYGQHFLRNFFVAFCLVIQSIPTIPHTSASPLIRSWSNASICDNSTFFIYPSTIGITDISRLLNRIKR